MRGERAPRGPQAGLKEGGTLLERSASAQSTWRTPRQVSAPKPPRTPETRSPLLEVHPEAFLGLLIHYKYPLLVRGRETFIIPQYYLL